MRFNLLRCSFLQSTRRIFSFFRVGVVRETKEEREADWSPPGVRSHHGIVKFKAFSSICKTQMKKSEDHQEAEAGVMRTTTIFSWSVLPLRKAIIIQSSCSSLSPPSRITFLISLRIFFYVFKYFLLVLSILFIHWFSFLLFFFFYRFAIHFVCKEYFLNYWAK